MMPNPKIHNIVNKIRVQSITSNQLMPECSEDPKTFFFFFCFNLRIRHCSLFKLLFEKTATRRFKCGNFLQVLLSWQIGAPKLPNRLTHDGN